MSTQRYRATDNLLTTLRRRERSLSWLARKIGVSHQLMSFVSRGERTLAEDKALRASIILDEPVEHLFVSTDATKSDACVDEGEQAA